MPYESARKAHRCLFTTHSTRRIGPLFADDQRVHRDVLSPVRYLPREPAHPCAHSRVHRFALNLSLTLAPSARSACGVESSVFSAGSESPHAHVAARRVAPVRLWKPRHLGGCRGQTDESPGWRPGCSITRWRGSAGGCHLRSSPKTESQSTKNRFGGDGGALPIV
jgi:hypothetical protein